MKIEKSSPVKKIELRSEASVDFRGKIIRVAGHDLVTHLDTRVNGKAIDSHFSGELYFSEEPPTFSSEQLVMTHEGVQLILHQPRESVVPDEMFKVNQDLKFGISFSYATKNTDG